MKAAIIFHLIFHLIFLAQGNRKRLRERLSERLGIQVPFAHGIEPLGSAGTCSRCLCRSVGTLPAELLPIRQVLVEVSGAPVEQVVLGCQIRSKPIVSAAALQTGALGDTVSFEVQLVVAGRHLDIELSEHGIGQSQGIVARTHAEAGRGGVQSGLERRIMERVPPFRRRPNHDRIAASSTVQREATVHIHIAEPDIVPAVARPRPNPKRRRSDHRLARDRSSRCRSGSRTELVNSTQHPSNVSCPESPPLKPVLFGKQKLNFRRTVARDFPPLRFDRLLRIIRQAASRMARKGCLRKRA